MKTFGPVPSRRLGHSLGINNILPKICTYSCVYCQLGRTIKMQAGRSAFYKPNEIVKEVKERVKKSKDKSNLIDYLTFVPDGEPTLDTNLGREIYALKSLGIRIAVLTNASLIWHEDVSNDLLKADWVSVKVDAVSEQVWRRINRSHKSLKLNTILDGVLQFAGRFKGELVTETMLVQGVNDSVEEIEKIADFLAKLKPDKAYIAVPTRPPAESWAKATSEQTITASYQTFIKRLDNVECLVGYEGNDFAFTGDVKEDLLSITAVHPMREEAVKELLAKANASWSIVDQLIKEHKLVELEYQGAKFYMRRLSR